MILRARALSAFGFGSLPAAQLLLPHAHHHHVTAGLHRGAEREADPS